MKALRAINFFVIFENYFKLKSPIYRLGSCNLERIFKSLIAPTSTRLPNIQINVCQLKFSLSA